MRRLSGLSGSVLLALLVACGSTAGAPAPAAKPAAPAATSAPPAAPTAPAATSAPAAAAAPAASPAATTGAGAASPGLQANAAEWERIKEAARREGKVVVSGPGFPGLRNGITEGFLKAYGITVAHLGLPPGEVITPAGRGARAGPGTSPGH